MPPSNKLLRCLAALALASCQFVHAQNFVHPGVLHTQADFDRMTQAVNAGTQPYLDGWNMLVNSTYSQSGWQHRAVATVIRGGTGDNVALLYNDVARAYQNALRWKISGSTAHGDTARNILNGWSSTLTSIGGNADRFLAAGIFGYQMANAAEIMRGYAGFNVGAMQSLLTNVFYPMNNWFLVNHNDACIENYWANWDLCNMASVAAIGIFCDRRDLYNQAVDYFKYGGGNGSIYNAVPFLHGNFAQWQESGRDQGHALLGIGLMASFCEMAWSQGDDMYGWANNRFMKAAEYVARYNNGNDDLPFSTYEWRSGQNCANNAHTVISNAGRGEYRPIWEMIYNHYANRKGLSVPNIAARATNHRPEGGPGGHATTFDQPGFGTLTFTRPAGGGSAAALHSGNLANGIYRLIALHSSKAVQAMGTANGSGIQQWATNGATSQQWTFTHLGAGEYRLTSVPSGRSLDINNAAHTNGASAIIWNATSGDNQRFSFLPISGGFFRVVPVHSSKSLDVAGVSTADGANIQQWKFLFGNNQQWRPDPVSVTLRLQSHNFPTRYVRHSNYRARIDANVSPAQDAQFKLVAGLADAGGVSLESVNFPGRFLRVRSNGEVWTDTNDNSTAFRNDASFRRVTGLAHAGKASFQMWTDASRYLRHSNYLLFAQSGSGATFNADATFAEVAP